MSTPLNILCFPCDLRTATSPIESRKLCATASDSDVVDLPVQKDVLPIDRTPLDTTIDTLIVYGVHDIEIVEDLVDVLFPQCSGLGVSLQGLEPREHNERSTVGIVNRNVCPLGRRRGFVIGVSAVCAHHDETYGSRRSKE
jgi:hypothetical protein